MYNKGKFKTFININQKSGTLRININNSENELRGLEDDNHWLETELRILEIKMRKINLNRNQEDDVEL